MGIMQYCLRADIFGCFFFTVFDPVLKEKDISEFWITFILECIATEEESF